MAGTPPPSPHVILSLGGGTAINMTHGKSELARRSCWPKVTWLISGRGGSALTSVPPFGHFSRPPLVTAGSREDQVQDRVPAWEPPACSVPAPLLRQVTPLQSLHPRLSQGPPRGRGLAAGSWPVPQEQLRACSARPTLPFASPPPLHPRLCLPLLPFNLVLIKDDSIQQ